VVVADSSVWIDVFNARPNPARELLRRLLHEGDTRLVVPDRVPHEVLHGCRDERARTAGWPLAVAVLALAGCATAPDPVMQTLDVQVQAEDPAWRVPLPCEASNAAGTWPFTAPASP